MHKCYKCGKTSNMYIGRSNCYVCGDCFSKYYKVPQGIKAEIQIKDIGKTDTLRSS